MQIIARSRYVPVMIIAYKFQNILLLHIIMIINVLIIVVNVFGTKMKHINNVVAGVVMIKNY